jgi:hypothetical protein
MIPSYMYIVYFDINSLKSSSLPPFFLPSFLPSFLSFCTCIMILSQGFTNFAWVGLKCSILSSLPPEYPGLRDVPPCLTRCFFYKSNIWYLWISLVSVYSLLCSPLPSHTTHLSLQPHTRGLVSDSWRGRKVLGVSIKYSAVVNEAVIDVYYV